jgi:hypothetical protein
MNEQLKHYLQPIIEQGLVQPENVHLLAGHIQLIIDDYDQMLYDVAGDMAVTQINAVDERDLRIASMKDALITAHDRIVALERQIAATRPAPHMAILQTPQYDLLWA